MLWIGRLRRIHSKSVNRFKEKIRELTSRKQARSIESILQRLKRYTTGWLGYYSIADMESKINHFISLARVINNSSCFGESDLNVVIASFSVPGLVTSYSKKSLGSIPRNSQMYILSAYSDIERCPMCEPI